MLSFLWPGLGQFYAGKRRLGALLGVPAVLTLLLIAYNLRQGIAPFATRLAVDPAFSTPAVLIVLLLGGVRLFAVGHAFWLGRPSSHRRKLEIAAVVALTAVVVVSHTAVGYGIWFSNNALNQAFTPGGNSSLIDEATAPPSAAPGSTVVPTITEVPATPVPIDHRVTILFTGVDSDPNRSEHLYDSIMVVSYDPKTNSIQMVSVPRDSASFPLYFGGQVSSKTRINSLPTYVRNGWVKSPDAPYPTLVKEISYLVGIPINYYAVMDLGGFVKMIDMVGGIDVNNPSEIDDPVYEWLDAKTEIGFTLAAGPQHLNGVEALAYVRSRHGGNNSDWARASRQQEVMVSLLHKMASPSQILALPSLISTVGSSVSTTFPASLVGDYVAIGQGIPKENFHQVVLGPPYTITGLAGAGSAATSCLLNYKVAELSIQLFGKDSLWSGKKAPANTCQTS